MIKKIALIGAMISLASSGAFAQALKTYQFQMDNQTVTFKAPAMFTVKRAPSPLPTGAVVTLTGQFQGAPIPMVMQLMLMRVNSPAMLMKYGLFKYTNNMQKLAEQAQQWRMKHFSKNATVETIGRWQTVGYKNGLIGYQVFHFWQVNKAVATMVNQYLYVADGQVLLVRISCAPVLFAKSIHNFLPIVNSIRLNPGVLKAAKNTVIAMRNQKIKAAKTGGEQAQSLLSDDYYMGNYPFIKSMDSALYWARKATRSHDKYRVYDYAQLLAMANKKTACQWMHKAVKLGITDAYSDLGSLYADGQGGCIKNEEKAVAYYRKGVAAGDDVAKYNLALHYLNATGVKKNVKQAKRIFIQQANQSKSMCSAYHLGNLYRLGVGVKANKKTALRWFEKAFAFGGDDIREKMPWTYALLRETFFPQAINNIYARYAVGLPVSARPVPGAQKVGDAALKRMSRFFKKQCN